MYGKAREIMKINKDLCYFCNREFKKEELTPFSNCSHKICTFCLFERIFSHHIIDLQGQKNLNVSCKCENSTLEIKISQILNILHSKRKIDLSKTNEIGFENVERTIEGCDCSKELRENNKQLFSDFFCLDCLKWVCAKCKIDKLNAHFNHRVLKSRYLIGYMKENIKNTDLNISNSDIFKEKWEEMSTQFQEYIDNYFNDTIHNLDNLIESAQNLKEFYLKEYEDQIENNVKTFKILKIYYMNYYADREAELGKKNAEFNDIYKLKYINNISYEFTNFKLIYLNELDENVLKIKKEIDNLKAKKFQLVKGNYSFKKIEKEYTLDEILTAHTKYISSLILMGNKIISGSRDYFMKVWSNETGLYKQKQVIKTKQIACLLGLKNGKILSSDLNSNNILVYQLNYKEEYEISQSLSNHDKCITTMVELEDGKFVSGSLDGKIIIWEEDTKLNQYIAKQKIIKAKPIILIISLDDFKLAYTGADNGLINLIGANVELIEEKIVSKDFYDIGELERLKGKVNCMCKLNNGYFVSGGGDFNKIIDHNIYIWKPSNNKFKKGQIILNAHEADINSIIMLRDGRIASASKDRTIKIWSIKKPIINNEIEFTINQELNHYGHGLYKLIQLLDDRIVVTATDNNIVFMKNSQGII